MNKALNTTTAILFLVLAFIFSYAALALYLVLFIPIILAVFVTISILIFKHKPYIYRPARDMLIYLSIFLILSGVEIFTVVFSASMLMCAYAMHKHAQTSKKT